MRWEPMFLIDTETEALVPVCAGATYLALSGPVVLVGEHVLVEEGFRYEDLPRYPDMVRAESTIEL